MYPLSHTDSSLTFTDLRGRIDDDQSVEVNLGLGQRFLTSNPLRLPGISSSSEAVLGYYGFADRLESEFDNVFYQATGGMEYFTKSYSLRINGYYPEDDRAPSYLSYRGSISGTQMFIEERQNYERPLPGYDVELGRTVRFDGWQLYGRGSYFRFHHSDVAEVEGSRFRAGVQLNGSHPDVYLPEGSQLTLGAEWQNDSVRDEQTFGVMRMRIPFGSSVEGQKSNVENKKPTTDNRPPNTDSGKSSWVYDRLTERIERDVDIVTARDNRTKLIESDPAVLASTGDTLDSVAVAAAGTSGSGRVGDPTDLATAVDQAGTDGTVFLVDSGGAFSTDGETIPGGQSVFGGNARIAIQTPDGRRQTAFRLGGGQPVITDNDTSTVTLVLRGGTSGHRIAGLSFDGGYNAIQGDNLSDVIVRDVEIRNTHREAILLENSTDATIRNVTVKNTTQSIILDNLTNVTVANLDVDSVLARGLEITSSDNVVIRNLDVRDAGTQGVWINGGDSLTLSNITVKRPGSDEMSSTGSSGISLDARNVTANSIDITEAGRVGFLIEGSSNQISDVTVTNSDSDGIEISGSDITLTDATVTSSGNHGLILDESSKVQVNDVSVRTAGGDGARINFTDRAVVDEFSARDVDGAGVSFHNSSDTITLRSTTIRNADTGVSVDLSAESLLPPHDGMQGLHFGPNFQLKGPIGKVFRSSGTAENLIDPSGRISAPRRSCRIEGTVTGSTLFLDDGLFTKTVDESNCQ